MPNQGPNSGGTFADDAGIGTITLTNPSNAQTSNDTYCTAVLLAGQATHYLKATNFSFNIPPDMIIDGILVEIERSATALSAVSDNSVKIVKGGSAIGTEKAAAGTWPSSDAYQSYGGSTDLWGTTWTRDDINASTFGVEISMTAALGATAQIDHIRVTVYFFGSNRPMNIGRRVRVGNGMSRSDSAT